MPGFLVEKFAQGFKGLPSSLAEEAVYLQYRLGVGIVEPCMAIFPYIDQKIRLQGIDLLVSIGIAFLLQAKNYSGPDDFLFVR